LRIEVTIEFHIAARRRAAPTGDKTMFDEMDTKKVVIGTVAAALLVIGVGYTWCGRAPQVGGDKESIKVVDALYTAVSSRNATRLTQCEERLHALRDEGKLPRKAADYLDGLIATARSGDWGRATHKLFDFMRAQRTLAA
jgi:hypothetical protein